MSGDQLSIALERLTLPDVWSLAPRGDSPPERAGVVKVNPFREDRNPSFSVTHDLKVFKDHARDEVKGGVWQFVKLAKPEWSKAEIARFLIRKAGLDPDEGRLEARGERREVRRAKEWRGGARSNPDGEAKRGPAWAAWPAGVRERWVEGLDFLQGDAVRREKIAAKRGWPVGLVDALVEMGVIAYPRLPWVDAKRGTAFLVQAPALSAAAGGEKSVSLVATGYHQRWWRPAKDGNPAEKSWLFMPSEKPEAEREEWPVKFKPQKTSPLPFVLGDVTAPRLVVLLEGQWDAVTFFHAAGWFGDGFPGGVCVLGIRGNQGAAPFFDEYGKVWSALGVRPAAWVIRDADAAGSTWDPPTSWVPDKRSFSERLRAMCSRVLVSRLRDEAGLGKDFNDYWRLKQPGPIEIAGMIERLGLKTI